MIIYLKETNNCTTHSLKSLNGIIKIEEDSEFKILHVDIDYSNEILKKILDLGGFIFSINPNNM